MTKTSIEWTDETWNPLSGCTKVSPGCAHCYAETVANRFWATQYPHRQMDGRSLAAIPVNVAEEWQAHGLTRPRKFTDVQCHEERLDQPLHWRKPRRVFVNSMSDLFHEAVPDATIDRIFAVMALCPQHTFQILTKRAERMPAYLGAGRRQRVIDAGEAMKPSRPPEHWYHVSDWSSRTTPWPLPNVRLGVSIEDQARADERFPAICELGEAGWNTMVSLEPLLGPVLIPGRYLALGRRAWLIIGGESGHGARPCDLAWIRSLLAQAKAASVPAFVKQLGSCSTDFAYPEAVSTEERKRWHAEGWTNIITKDGEIWTKHPRLRNAKGGDPTEWPEDLRVREFPK